ncbi:MAG TPA: hypothetical protein VMT99_00995 [Candidatus Paceibacterota bacterium]|nr:hypothetical protein [Candidatus Paceibacterota bacterium]
MPKRFGGTFRGKASTIAIIAGFAALAAVSVWTGVTRYGAGGHAAKGPFADEPIFQPEEQMLSQAINNASTAALAANATTVVADFAVASGTKPYAYDSMVCASAEYPNTCFSTFYRKLTMTYGVDAAFSDIKQRYNENQFVQTDCHPLMHIIGQAASALYPDVSQAYLHGDSFCWSGYYHGILEGVVARIGAANLPKQLNTICAGIPGKAAYSFDYYNCVHGLGHGIMEVSEHDVIASLHMCDNLTGSWEESSCYGGVFMENIINDNNEHDSKFLKKDDPMYPCDIVDAKYKYQCYLGQTSYALEVTGYDFKKVSTLCTQVDEPFRDICEQSFGRDAANQAGHAPAPTKDYCMINTDPNDQANCVIGAVKEIISYYHSEDQAKDFCAVLDQSQQTLCNSTADEYYKAF